MLYIGESLIYKCFSFISPSIMKPQINYVKSFSQHSTKSLVSPSECVEISPLTDPSTIAVHRDQT
jgi:hypothetical protein